MFRRLEENGAGLVEIELDGEPVKVPDGISMAAALFYLDALPSRHTVLSQSPRAPFCMMGVCFECLVDVDELGSQRACQLAVRPGLRVRRRLETSACGSSA